MRNFYTVTLPYNYRETVTQRKERRQRDHGILKSKGFKVTNYFHFPDGNDKLEAAAKSRAESFAVDIERVTGVKMEVSRGFWM